MEKTKNDAGLAFIRGEKTTTEDYWAALDAYADKLNERQKELEELMEKYKQKLIITPINGVIKISDLRGRYTRIDFDS